MNTIIPNHKLPDFASHMVVSANIDYIKDAVVDSIPSGSGHKFRMTPIFGNQPIRVESIAIEAGFQKISSDQLAILRSEVEKYMLLGDGWHLIN